MTLQGQVVKSFLGKTSSVDIISDYIACTCSPRGEFIYFLAENGWLHCFATAHGNLVNKLKVAEKGPIGVTHHPKMSVIASCSQDGVLKTWKAG
jgi:WD40 repeat-containing protein SMU1